IQKIDAAGILPDAGGVKAVKHRHQRCRAIDHRRIDHLPFAGAPRLHKATRNSERQIKSTAAEIADEIERWYRFSTLLTNGVQCSGKRNVIDVVPGRMRERPRLSPPRHPSINKPRIAPETDVGPK